jgi:hypothetical protein
MNSDDDVMLDMQLLMQNTKETLRTIPNTNLYANSVNAYVGRPRSGKTFAALHDIISIIRNDPTVHLLVYINASGTCDDDTFNNVKCLIDVPIEFVKYDSADSYLKQLTTYKNYYNEIRSKQLQNKMPEDLKQELFQTLKISSFNRSSLHTLILLEDATNSNSIRNANSFVNDLLVRCAHTQLSFFILIHYWKAMTTNVKANLSSIRIFPGYSPQQLSYMLYQTNMPITFKELYKQYSNLSADLHQSIFIDCINADYVFYS